jgi:hypothetical protein
MNTISGHFSSMDKSDHISLDHFLLSTVHKDLNAYCLICIRRKLLTRTKKRVDNICIINKNGGIVE